MENLFKIMQNFGELYAIVSDEERKAIISYLIKEIQICPHDEADNPLKSIEFNSPIYHDGQEIKELLREKGNTVECAVLMSRVDGEYPRKPCNTPFFCKRANLAWGGTSTFSVTYPRTNQLKKCDR